MIFGEWSIDISLFNWLKSNIDSGKVLLELGSGRSTSELYKIFNVYSIEENIGWVGKYHNNYIYAPIKDNWYDLESIRNGIPKSIDAILIDGPAHGDRNGFFENIELFLDLSPEILIFDDVDRENDYNCYLNVVKYLRDKNINIQTEVISDVKKFSFIKIIK